ncbi:MAG TPA: hypothetical protein VF198_05115 [Vicinamibacterales bacterium]
MAANSELSVGFGSIPTTVANRCISHAVSLPVPAPASIATSCLPSASTSRASQSSARAF